MNIQLIKKTEQAKGQFNGGEILENKPIGFPREGGLLKPYSNLFYWAHAWSENGSTIGLHPHQGFEIMSFVLKGSIEHFDTSNNEWRRLEVGDAQIIRSGSGISHSEKLNEGAHMFQIWFDPNLDKTIKHTASYNDYENISFPVVKERGIQIKTYKGEGSPLQMVTEGIEIKELSLEEGTHKLDVNPKTIHSFYVIEGGAKFESEDLVKDDFAILKDSDRIKIETKKESKIFWISSPLRTSYATYAELINS